MSYLLDTQAFIRMDSQPEKLPDSVTNLLESTEEDLIVSLVTVWEMQIKSQLGKLKLRLALPDLINDQISSNRIALLPIELAHLFVLTSLAHHHRDSFDRLLIAQAKIEKLVIITNDPQIRKYDVQSIW